MAKKQRGAEPPEKVQTLTHNPFAALAGSKATPALAPEAPAPTVAKPEVSASPAPAAKAPSAREKSRGRVVLRRETKHRGGKAVVIVTGLSELRDFDAQAAQALAQRLKKQLGCGGTLEETPRGREIVLQGDRPAQVAELLRGLGFRVDGVTS